MNARRLGAWGVAFLVVIGMARCAETFHNPWSKTAHTMTLGMTPQQYQQAIHIPSCADHIKDCSE